MNNSFKLLHKFHELVLNNECEQVRELLDANPEIDIDAEVDGCSPILVSAQNANWEMLTILFEREAALDVKKSPHNWYLIHACVLDAPMNIAKSVIKYSNINSPTRNGQTPLMVAIKAGNTEIANHIIDTGRAELFLQDSNKDNALHYAGKYANEEIFVKLMNQMKKGLLIKNKEGKCAHELIEDNIFRESLMNNFTEPSKIEIPIQYNEVNNKNELIVEELKIETKIDVPVKKIGGLSSISKKIKK